MDLILSRIILFSADVPKLARFYQDVIGLTPVDPVAENWVELRAGGCAIAIHAGRPRIGARPPKLVFHAEDIAAARTMLIDRGWTDAGPVKSGAIDLCDGRDIDGNAIQLSSRPRAI